MMPSPSPSRWPNSAIIVTVILGLVVLMLGGLAVVMAVRMSQLNEELAATRSDVDQAEARIADLEQKLAAAESSAGDIGSLLGDLLGGGGSGDLGIEDLLGLLGGDSQGLSGLEDLLGGLLGGQSGDSGGLGSLLESLGQSGGLGSCLGTPGSYQITDASLEAQVDDIGRAVEDLRGLTFPSEIEPVFVSPDEMAERVRNLVEDGYPQAVEDFDTRLLVALGMIDPGYDLRSAQLDLLDTGVAGYYSGETGELVVATADDSRPLGAIDQITLAHEMIHALTDARLGLPESIEDPNGDPEIIRAQQALIEGDATLGMQQFSLGALGLDEQLAMLTDPRLLGAPLEAGRFPYVLSNGLQLPYIEGMSFTCALYADGGWAAVDAAYDDPPTNTSQILFPERYLVERVEAADPGPLEDPGAGWDPVRVTGFGAVDLLMLFSAPGDDPTAALNDPRERARAWAGGLVGVWSRDADTVAGISLVDNGEGSESLCDSMVTWEMAAFPNADDQPLRGTEQLAHSSDGRSAVIACEGDDVRIGIGPDLDTSRTVASGRS